VWNPQVHFMAATTVNACVKLGTGCNFMQTCECAKAWKHSWTFAMRQTSSKSLFKQIVKQCKH